MTLDWRSYHTTTKAMILLLVLFSLRGSTGEQLPYYGALMIADVKPNGHTYGIS